VAGHRVVYLDRGEGEPMLLVHGFGADKDNWTFLAANIPDAYRVIALDLPGFGESQRRDDQSYDVRAQVERLLAFADALHLERFHLAGNSMGGAISARFAIEHPDRVRSLFLLDSSGLVAPHPSELDRALAAGQNPLLVTSVDDFDRFLALGFVKPPDIPTFIKRYFAEQAVAHRPFNDKIFADVTRKRDVLASDLPKIAAPTLILWGAQDRIIDVSAAGLFQSAIPGARLSVLEQCGHAPMIEKPKETASDYLDFLASLTPPARAQ